MKKLYILLSAGLLSAGIMNAQSVMSEAAPVMPGNTSTPSVAAVTPWQLTSYDITAGAGAGNAGVAFTGTEFWISRWASDSMFTYDLTGNMTSAFAVPGVTAIRSLTWDGTSIYAGGNTAQIFKIDPATKTLTSTISVPSVPNIRYCTYDATANSGAGGFWVGTWTTDFTLVSMTGAVLNTAAAANHGLTATYGLAYDNASPGGPFFWAFHQTAASNAADIIQVDATTGFQTGVFHDVTSDIGTVGDLAGGLFFQASPLTLYGILQGTPNYLLSYDVQLVGINENAKDPSFVSAFPNPVTDMVNVGVKRTNNDVMNMQIFNNNGKIVFESSNVGVSNMINMSKYPTGVYTIKVTHNGQVYTKQIVRK